MSLKLCLTWVFFQPGFTVEMEKAENCGDGNPVYTIGKDSKAYMTDACDFVVEFCGNTIGYNTNVVRKQVSTL